MVSLLVGKTTLRCPGCVTLLVTPKRLNIPPGTPRSIQIQHALRPHIPPRQVLHIDHAPHLHGLDILPAEHTLGGVATRPVGAPEGLVLAGAAPQVHDEDEDHQPRRGGEQPQGGEARREGQADEDERHGEADRQAVALEHALGADRFVRV